MIFVGLFIVAIVMTTLVIIGGSGDPIPPSKDAEDE